MLLPHIQEQIKKAPKYIAGVSFSDRMIRFVQVEQKKGIATLFNYGHIKIPFDVVVGGVVKDRVAFIESVKKLNGLIRPKARIIVRGDDPHGKAEILSIAGFSNVTGKDGYGLFKYIFTPAGINTERVGIFANGDISFVFICSQDQVSLAGKITREELFGLSGKQKIKAILEEVENQEILLAGVYDDERYEQALTSAGFKVKWTNLWMNIFDFDTYVPEMHFEESFEFTVPIALLVSGVFEGITKSKRDKPSKLSTKEMRLNLEEMFGGEQQAMTKSKEDFE